MSFVFRDSSKYPLKRPARVEQVGEGGGSVGGAATVIDVANYELTLDDSGGTFILNRASGIDIELPVTTSEDVGVSFDFLIGTAITTSGYDIINGQYSSVMVGKLLHYDTDTSNALNVYSGNGTSDNAVSMNAASGAGTVGGWFRFTAVAANRWNVSGVVFGTGTPASPFATLE
jgi:hypothetical protein